MKFGSVIFVVMMFIVSFALASFEQGKHSAQNFVFVGHLRKDYYCGCSYNERGRMDWSSCGYYPYSNSQRGSRLEWEHVVPAHFYVQSLPCARYGRRGCRQMSDQFRLFEGDLHNLRPVVGELNAVRSSKPYGEVRNRQKMFGKCEFYLDKNVAEPPDNVKGDLARITMYIADKYHIRFPDSYIALMHTWSAQDPVDDREREVNMKIESIQGDSNPYVK